jgi:hypothetical protein
MTCRGLGVEVVLVAGARGHFLFLSFIVRLVIQSQYVVLPELRPTSPALAHLVTLRTIDPTRPAHSP